MDDQVMGVAQQGLGRVQDAVGGLTGEAKTQAKGKLNEAVGASRQALGDLKDGVAEQVSETVGHVQSLVNDQLSALESQVIRKPLPALAGAAVVGVLLGLLLSGRRRTVYLRDHH